MEARNIHSKLSDGMRIYGTAIVSSSPHWPRIIKGIDLDFAFIDTEHMALDRQVVMTMCQLYRGIGIAPLVRILSPDPFLASMALDAGAMGILAPYVEHVDQVEAMVGAVKYRPLKGEKLAAVIHQEMTLDPQLAQYLEHHNRDRFLWINIESVLAVENLPSLLKIKGLDGVMIGPHDLSCSMDIPEQYDHPDFVNMVKKIIAQCRAHHCPVGIHFSADPQRQIDWAKEGVSIILHSSDMALFQKALSTDLNTIRSELGDERSTDDLASSTI